MTVDEVKKVLEQVQELEKSKITAHDIADEESEDNDANSTMP